MIDIIIDILSLVLHIYIIYIHYTIFLHNFYLILVHKREETGAYSFEEASQPRTWR